MTDKVRRSAPRGERATDGRDVYPGEGRRWFVWSGEYRAPRKGEWFLSGAVVEAYKAHDDLRHPFYIAREVEVRRELMPVIVRDTLTSKEA